MKTKKLVLLAILASLSTVLSIIETFIPTGIPSVKLGLANIGTLIILYTYSSKDSMILQVLRIFLVGLLYSGILSLSFLISLFSGVFSCLVMIVIHKLKSNNIFIVSILGSITHSTTELLISLMLLENVSVLLYLPITLVLSVITGMFIAIISKLVLKAFKVEVDKPKVMSLIVTFSSVIILSVLIVLGYTYNKSSNEKSIAVITYNNEIIMNISLDNPSDYKSNSDSFIEYKKIDDSYLYTFKVYNKDEKDYFNIIVEVKDSKIRIKEETCKKHICSTRGFIKNKYESIVCLPNNFIISIKDYKLDEIDAVI